MSESRRLGLLFIGPALIIALSAMVWLITTGSGKTWAYFASFEDQLIHITTGSWASPPPQPGTSLEAEKTAAGFWERRDDADHIGVRGEVCVTNAGDLSTENLAILDVVQIKTGAGGYTDYVSAPVDVSSFPVLMPGESHCYHYEIEFTPVERAKYRNLARVTITNHSGWLPGGPHCPGPEPCPFGPEPKASFRLPRRPDEGSDNMPILPDMKRTSTPTVVPTQADNEGMKRQPTANVPTPSITPTPEPSPTLPPTPTPAPTENSPGICTHSVDYWRSHPEEWPLREIFLGGKRYSLNDALAWLAAPYAGDVSIYLVQQLIAVRLNIANGSDASSIEGQLAAADEWLATNPPGSAPRGPAARSGRSIAEELEAYNLGDIGPGACQEDPYPTPAPTQAPFETATWTPTSTPSLAPTDTFLPPATLTPASTATPTLEDVLPSPTLPTPAPTQSNP